MARYDKIMYYLVEALFKDFGESEKKYIAYWKVLQIVTTKSDIYKTKTFREAKEKFGSPLSVRKITSKISYKKCVRIKMLHISYCKNHGVLIFDDSFLGDNLSNQVFLTREGV